MFPPGTFETSAKVAIVVFLEYTEVVFANVAFPANVEVVFSVVGTGGLFMGPGAAVVGVADEFPGVTVGPAVVGAHVVVIAVVGLPGRLPGVTVGLAVAVLR